MTNEELGPYSSLLKRLGDDDELARDLEVEKLSAENERLRDIIAQTLEDLTCYQMYEDIQYLLSAQRRLRDVALTPTNTGEDDG